MYCPRCGSQLPDGAKFCSRCGATLDGERPAAPVPAPARRPAGSRPRRGRIVAIVAAALVVLLAGGAAASWFLLRPRPVWVVTHAKNVTLDAVTFDCLATRSASVGYAEVLLDYVHPSAFPNRADDFSVIGQLDRTLGPSGATQGVSDGGPVMDVVSDDHGNAVSVPDDSEGRYGSYEVTYDDRSRPERVSLGNTYWAFSYGNDGSCTIEGHRGGTASNDVMFEMRGVGADGVVEWIVSYDDDRGETRYEYEDGFLRTVSTSDESGLETGRHTFELERDGAGYVTAVVSTDGYWGPTVESVEDGIGAGTLATRVCFEYDGDGNISRLYVPWEPDGRDALKAEWDQSVPNEDVLADVRYTYQRVDDPTPLMRVIGGNLI